eukprot:m.23457 g.23457  ORF g.23457 m.23457 type:complete len:386 (-) comp3906_c0_seq1:233-1390(-)
MSSWVFERKVLEDSPSRQDGLLPREEHRRMYKAFVLVKEICTSLKLEPLIMNTTMTLFHRFYVYQSFRDFDNYEMAMCCLFLALKIEEKVQRMESILKWGHHIRFRLTQPGQQPPKLDVKSREYFEMAERLQIHERILLQTTGFDLTITHPGWHIFNFVTKTLPRFKCLPDSASDSKAICKLTWGWAHASFGSNFVVRFESDVIACAMIKAAARQLKVELRAAQDGRPWFAMCAPRCNEHVMQEFLCEFHDYCLSTNEPREPNIRMEHPCDRPSHAKLLARSTPSAAAGAAPSPYPAASAAPSPAARPDGHADTPSSTGAQEMDHETGAAAPSGADGQPAIPAAAAGGQAPAATPAVSAAVSMATDVLPPLGDLPSSEDVASLLM